MNRVVERENSCRSLGFQIHEQCAFNHKANQSKQKAKFTDGAYFVHTGPMFTLRGIKKALLLKLGVALS